MNATNVPVELLVTHIRTESVNLQPDPFLPEEAYMRHARRTGYLAPVFFLCSTARPYARTSRRSSGMPDLCW